MNSAEPQADLPANQQHEVPQPPVTPFQSATTDEATLQKVAVNKNKRRHAMTLAAVAACAVALIIMILTPMGLATGSYEEAQQISNIATIVAMMLALIGGVFAAYTTAHPVWTVPENSGHNFLQDPVAIVVIIVAGLLLGIIPGIICLLIFVWLKKKEAADRKAQQASTAGGARPRMILRPANIIIIGLSFVLGLIPGLILSVVITYPLSKHACELSGSKYC